MQDKWRESETPFRLHFGLSQQRPLPRIGYCAGGSLDEVLRAPHRGGFLAALSFDAEAIRADIGYFRGAEVPKCSRRRKSAAH